MTRDVATLVAAEDHPYDELLELAAKIVARAIGDFCTIALLSDDGRELHPLGLFHRDDDLQRELEAADRLTWASFGSVSQAVLASGAPALFDAVDLGRAARDRAWPAVFVGGSAVHSAAVVAMRASGRAIGVIAVARHAGSAQIGEADAPFLQAVADRLALAVENLRLKEEVERLHHREREPLPNPRLATLTQRELEILALIGEGLTSREISERLFLSVRTVEWHRGRLCAKLGERQRSELIALGRTLNH